MSSTVCYPGFAWALPKAFCDPLGACRFEEGDTFYDTPHGYSEWTEAKARLKHGIQIKFPRKANKATLQEEDDGVFGKNWNEPVILDLTDYQAGTRREIRTTQGRLYCVLRTGNLAVLEEETPCPDVPFLVVEGTRALDALNRNALAAVTAGMKNPNVFILATDPTNPVARRKLIDVRECLSEHGVSEKEFTPHDLGLPEPDRYAPTVSYIAFAADTGATEKVRDCLKKTLYKPSKDRKTEKDKFNLRRHGLFIPHKEKHYSDIATISYLHGEGLAYRFRLNRPRAERLPKGLQSLFDCLLNSDCPNHCFKESPTCSHLHLELPIDLKRERNHPIIEIAGASAESKKYKSRHENLQTFFMENDPLTIATEIPVWMEAEEYEHYEHIFPEGGTLTGHIDLLRLEGDGKIGIWDYKPNAFNERYAAAQIYMYAAILSCRTEVPLSSIICGYFDESNAFTFDPGAVSVIGKQEQSRLL